MELLKEADFKKEIKSAPRSGYFFFGDEDYLKAFALRQAREAIAPDPTFSFFNEIKLDAVDFEAQKLVDALMPMPMMAEKKLITLSGFNFGTMKPSELDELCDAFSLLEEYDYNVLILSIPADGLNAGYFPKSPSPTFKKLAERLTPVQFERCSTAKLAAWVQKHFAHNGVEASPAFCTLFPEYCGHSMYILANEIDKLSFYLLSHQKTVADEDTMRLVCTPALEYDAFAFTNAVAERRLEAALGILSEYRLRRMDPVIVLSEATRVICDMLAVHSMSREGTPPKEIATMLLIPEFRVLLYQKSLRGISPQRLERMLASCVSADRSLKSAANDYAPLERLICEL